MAHFAQLDDNNQVLQVIVISNTDILDAQGQESEEVGIAWCHRAYGAGTKWKQTSYNNRIRKNYAIVGGRYSPELDAFIAPQPYPSWALDERACVWLAPTPLPEDGKAYYWDEPNLRWVQLGTTE